MSAYYAYGNSGKNLFDAKDDGSMQGQADWGYNAISNGGNQENIGWHTLTRDEWFYLFKQREMQNNSPRFTAGKRVENMLGVIIYPDNYNGLEVTSDLSATDWATDYEAAGCVFLPAAGTRIWSPRSGQTTKCSDVGSVGGYCSASVEDNDYAYYLSYFALSENYDDILTTLDKRSGYSVRLALPSLPASNASLVPCR